MLARYACGVIIAIVVGWFFVPATRADTADVEDRVSVQIVDDRVVAFIPGRGAVPIELHVHERANWKGARGFLGAVLTNERFLVFASRSAVWRAFPLRSRESILRPPLISENLTLLITSQRLVAYDHSVLRFFETDFRLAGSLIDARIDRTVAVVVTSDQVVGLTRGAEVVSAVELRRSEAVESVETTERLVTVRTSQRLLHLDNARTGWREFVR